MTRELAIKTELARRKNGLERVEQKLDQSIEDNANFFNETGIFFDKMKNDLEKRIERLEEHTGFNEN